MLMGNEMPSDVKESLDAYAKVKRPTGGFLRAFLSNNLMDAIGRADDNNILCFHAIASYIYNNIPYTCHGSPKIVKEWLGEK